MYVVNDSNIITALKKNQAVRCAGRLGDGSVAFGHIW